MKLSKAESTVLAGVLTLIATSLSASLAGLHPFFGADRIDWTGLALYVSVTALPTLGASLLAYLKSHPQEVTQAAEDSMTQLGVPQATVNAIHAMVGQILGFMQSQATSQPTPPTPPVTVNVTSPVPMQVQATGTPQKAAPLAPQPVQTVTPVSTDVSQVNTTSMPTVPSSVQNPLADYSNPLNDNDDTQTKVQIVQAQRRVS